jgi:1,4-alpha-glucan branching enzyme
MEALVDAHRHRKTAPLTRRALNQCLRELLLAQSSDWPFIMYTGTAAEYAARRVKDHVARFHFLSDAVEQNRINSEELRAIEYLDNIFPGIDYRIFAAAP